LLRSRIGALVKLYDVPASQLWIGAVAIGLRYADENAPTGTALTAIVALAAISLVFFYLMGINDYFDADIDATKGERSVLAGGELTKRNAKLAVSLVACLGLFLAFLVSLRFLAFSLVIFALSTFYSAPPVRYKRFYPFSTLGELAGAFVLFLLGYSVIGLPTVTAVFISTITTLVAASARLKQEARNAEFDSRTGKMTFAVVHGPNVVKEVSRGILILAFAEVVGLRVVGLLSSSTAALAGLFVLAPVLVKQAQDRRYLRLSGLLWGFGIYLLAVFLPRF
jgi:4-hydroxybenzoate polyprenyltransferase